jgi:hypothetical protein
VSLESGLLVAAVLDIVGLQILSVPPAHMH